MASNSKNIAELLNTDTTIAVGDVADGSVTTAKLAASAVTTAKIADDAVSSAKLFAENLGRRNLIINGAMQVAQRGTSFTPISGTVYTLDRQTFYHNMGSHTVEQSTDAPAGFTNSLIVTVTTAGTISGNTINQLGIAIEGYDTVGLRWDGKGSAKPATASFWVKTSVAGTYAYRIRLVGVGTIVKEFTVNSANTWEYKTISIPACPYTIPNFQNGMGFFVGWQLDCGTTYQSTANGAWETPDNYGTTGMTNNFGQTLNATFQVTGHQFEVGDTATPFEHRSYGEELSLCQRYYQEIGHFRHLAQGARWTTNQVFVTYNLASNMRATPAATASGVPNLSRYDNGQEADATTLVTVGGVEENTTKAANITIIWASAYDPSASLHYAYSNANDDKVALDSEL